MNIFRTAFKMMTSPKRLTRSLTRQSRPSDTSDGDEPTRLEQLPDVPLRRIAFYLSFDDALTLSRLSPAWAHLQPTVQRVVGEDFDLRGPESGHFCPETYFDVPIATRNGIKSVNIEWRWRDQGFGNRKGQIWLRLVRNGVEIADARYVRALEGPLNLYF